MPLIGYKHTLYQRGRFIALNIKNPHDLAQTSPTSAQTTMCYTVVMVSPQLAPQKPPEAQALTPKPKLDKRKLDFIRYWTDFNSDSFGNVFQSGIKAGYSPKVSRQLTSNYKNLDWIKDAKEYMDNFSPLHIVSGLQALSKSARADRDKIAALDRLAKIKGMYVDQQRTEVNVTFANSVPRPVIDSEPISPPEPE